MIEFGNVESRSNLTKSNKSWRQCEAACLKDVSENKCTQDRCCGEETMNQTYSSIDGKESDILKPNTQHIYVKFKASEPILVVFEAEHLRFPISTFHPIDNSMYIKEVERVQAPIGGNKMCPIVFFL